MKHCFRLLFFSTCVLLGWPMLSKAQDPKFEGSIEDTIDIQMDLFSEDAPLEITLRFDMKRYRRTKMKGKYMPAGLSYLINDTLQINKTIRIKSRGDFRRGYCFYPPFWLNIRGSGLKVGKSKDIKRMKMVTQCMRSHSYADYVIKEYLAYRMYQLLSPASFRTRLVRIKYVDTARDYKETETWGFILEPEALLAERLNGKMIDLEPGRYKFDKEAMTLVSVFEYMIGNPDYSLQESHNIKYMGLPEYEDIGYTPVPYDFDYSGMVNTTYSIPHELLPIENVRERIYLGPCREEVEYRKTLDHILEYQEDILNLVSSSAYLSKGQKKEILYYLEDYFELSERRSLEILFKDTCR